MNPLTENQIERLYRRADGDLARKVTEIIDWINDQSDTVLGEEIDNGTTTEYVDNFEKGSFSQPLTEGEGRPWSCAKHGTGGSHGSCLKCHPKEDGDLLSICCQAEFDAFGFERPDGLWDEKCLECGKLCDVKYTYYADIKPQESNKEEEFDTEWMKGKSLSELSKEPSKKPVCYCGHHKERHDPFNHRTLITPNSFGGDVEKYKKYVEDTKKMRSNCKHCSCSEYAEDNQGKI